jgi:tRNA threonylcarbamoyladenosine biosynthesis protein TsaB
VSVLLHIETAVEGASLCLSQGDKILGYSENPSQKDSAAWVQPGIQQLVKEQGLQLRELSAVSVSAGPGSYTGLRVGMSSAKGLCYALGIPLITISTLKMMAVAALAEEADLLCPLIDARRMEVFTAVYDKELREVVPPHNRILDPESFAGLLQQHRVCFFGNGSEKFQPLVRSPRALFASIRANATHLVPLALQLFENKAFADLAYSEPYYGKEFFSTYIKSKS